MAKETTSSSLVSDIQHIVECGMRQAYANVNSIGIRTYWLVGQRIVEEEQKGAERATYGTDLIGHLSKELSTIYSKGYTARNLREYRQFYLYFKDFEIWHSRVPNLTWTHYRMLLRVADEDARYWYLREVTREMWSVRTLDRNIGSQYYYRLLQSTKKDAVVSEMLEKTTYSQNDKQEFVKSPVVAEFLQLPSNTDYTESDLEHAILAHLKSFILEMGRGFAFMSEQYHIATDTADYFVDLVFYNVILKCYFLIDLKTTTITHQDVGQMDMYVRMFDELKRTEGDNPTIGLLLCAETSADIARYSVLHENEQLFAAKYLTYLPTEKELRNEIEQQKQIYALQRQNENNNSNQ